MPHHIWNHCCVHFCWHIKSYIACFGFLPQILRQNGTLSFYECRFSSGDTTRWYKHSNPTLYKIICLNFLHTQLVPGTQKFWVQALMPSLMFLLMLLFMSRNNEPPCGISTTSYYICSSPETLFLLLIVCYGKLTVLKN